MAHFKIYIKYNYSKLTDFFIQCGLLCGVANVYNGTSPLRPLKVKTIAIDLQIWNK